MKTVRYYLNGTEDTITQVVKVDFKYEPGKLHIKSEKDGDHLLPIDHVISID